VILHRGGKRKMTRAGKNECIMTDLKGPRGHPRSPNRPTKRKERARFARSLSKKNNPSSDASLLNGGRLTAKTGKKDQKQPSVKRGMTQRKPEDRKRKNGTAAPSNTALILEKRAPSEKNQHPRIRRNEGRKKRGKHNVR